MNKMHTLSLVSRYVLGEGEILISLAIHFVRPLRSIGINPIPLGSTVRNKACHILEGRPGLGS